MNAEITELKAVQVEKIEECADVLALSIDDLDLVGGGAFVGVNV